MDLQKAIPLIQNSTMSKGCWVIKDKFKFCRVDAGREKKIFKNITYLKDKNQIDIFTKQAFNQNSLDVWKKLNDLSDTSGILIPSKENIITVDDYIYTKVTYCEANANLNTGLTEKTLMDQFRNLKDDKTRLQFKLSIEKNFRLLKDTINEIHKLGLEKLDIKPDNMLISCQDENKANIVLTDLDGANTLTNFTLGYIWFDDNNKKNDLFALCISFLEIIEKNFFRKSVSSFLGNKSDFITYCENRKVGMTDLKNIIINELKELLEMNQIKHASVMDIFADFF